MQTPASLEAPMQPPRIAVVAHSHPSLTKGGAEISAYTLYKGLGAIGCEVIFIAACPENLRHKVARNSADEYILFTRSEYYEPFFQLGAPYLSAALESILTERRIQLVNFHHYINFGLGALRRVRRIPDLRIAFTLHEYLAICANHGQMTVPGSHRLCEGSSPEACAACFPGQTRYDFHMRDRLFREALGQCDLLISPSYFLADRYQKWGVPEEKLFVVENGLAHVAAAPAVASSTRRREWTFGYFGQINPFKGVDVLLEAAGLLQRQKVAHARIRIHGNLIGQGEEFCNQLKLACESRIVEYSGAYENRSVARLMAECDYVVVPSRWWENSPVVIQEAFAAGKPVICTGLGGMAEKVRPGHSGLHFQLGDAADLARCFVEASSEDVYKRLVKGIPKPFDGAEMARRYLQTFMLRKKPAPAADIREESAIHTISFG